MMKTYMQWAMRDASIQNAKSIIYGFHDFLERHVGDVPDNATKEQVEQFLINSERLMANDLHYLDVGGNGTPGGTTTTETQSVLILGYIALYEGVGDPMFLKYAEMYWDAYVKHFYLGKPVPDTPQEWRCHWMLNAKEPFNSSYPINTEDASESGFLGIEFDWVNGQTVIPEGTPYFGEVLQRVTFAFQGKLIWKSVDARVRDAGSWSKKGKVYEVEWFINSKGVKLGPDGDRIDLNPTNIPKGTIKLSGKVFEESTDGKQLPDEVNFTGKLKLNFATANGVVIGRNEPFDPRPLWTPLSEGFEGNASDAEQWFSDACFQLWQLTKKEKYKKAYESTIKTIEGYADIDRGTRYWRKSTAPSPFTEGISYTYARPDTAAVELVRDIGTKTIKADFSGVNEKFEYWMEVQAVPYKVTDESYISSELKSTVGGVVLRNEITTNKTNTDTGADIKVWSIPNNVAIDSTLREHKLYVKNAVNIGDNPMIIAGSGNTWGDLVLKESFATGIMDENRNGMVTHYETTNGGGGWMGMYHLDDKPTPVNITYRTITNTPFFIYFKDAGGKEWTYTLPTTNGEWTTHTFDYSKFTGQTGTFTPAPLESFEIKMDADVSTVQLYSFNSLPELYKPAVHGEFIIMHKTIFEAKTALKPVINIGDVMIKEYSPSRLAYTPGAVPFSNNYNPLTGNYSAWRGMPYLGYQYGWVWRDNKEFWDNVVSFHVDSQTAYEAKHKVSGPGSPGYVWDRWDNTGFGETDTFVDLFWKTKTPWSGYFPRAMLAVCRMYQDEYDRTGKVDAKLATCCDKWINFLDTFLKSNGGKSPTHFSPTNGPTYTEGEFGGHMTANFLSGACKMAMSGSTNSNLEYVIETLYKEIVDNYHVVGPDAKMNGSYSDWVGGNMFFGFWAGDILKSLGMYIKYQRHIGRA
ncbi:tail protein [Vibrio phage D528]